MPILEFDQLLAFSTRILEASDCTTTAARRVAEQLVEANLTGHDSHGVVRLTEYCRHIAEGRVNLTAAPEIVQETNNSALIDGHVHWGPVVLDFAVDLALQKARAHGIAAVSVRRAHHVGRVGTYTTAIAEDGFLGIAFCDVQGASRVAPWGSFERRLGTNPISIAVPTRGTPILVDFATSAVAEGKVRLAKIAGQSVPPGWVVGSDGRPSTDPNDAYESGAMAPLGLDQGHKGYALSTAMNLLGGVLSGAGWAQQADHYGNSLLLIVVDPTLFGPPEDFLERVSSYVEYIKSAAPGKGVSEIWMPGDKEEHSRRDRMSNGIPISDSVWNELCQLAERLKVPAPGT